MRLLIPALSLFLIFFSACEESAEGCLDRLSENYGFDAVNACDSCCSYPEFKLFLGLEYDSLEYTLGDTLPLENLDTIVLEAFKLSFSNFEFAGYKEDHRVRDSLVRNMTHVILDQILFEDDDDQIVGETRFEDTVHTVGFRIGLDQDELYALKPFSGIDQSGNLDTVLDSLYSEELDLLYLGEFVIKDIRSDTLRTIEISNDLRLDLVFNKELAIQAGEDWSLRLVLDLKELFNELELNSGSEDIAQKLMDKMSGSLTMN